MNELNNFTLEKVLEKIKGFINTGEINAAKELLGMIEKSFELSAELITMQSTILILEENYEQAEKKLQEGLSHFPLNQDIIFNLAYLNEVKENYLEAYYLYNDVCKIGDEFAQKDASEKIEYLSGRFDFQESDLKKIVFFVREGLDNFIDDIIMGLSSDYRTKKVIVTSYEQIDQGMDWADICWFEWCDELLIYASKLSIAIEKTIICRLHSYEAFTSAPSRINWQTVDKVIFVAKHIEQYVIENEKTLSKKQTIVIPNGIDLNKHRFKSRKNGFNFAYVGYINYKKGPMLLLHAFKAIYNFDKRYKLYIAGEFQDPRYVLYYEQMVKEMGLENNVFFEGWQSNIDEWLEDKDYILSTSVLESQHLSVMEAMAKGIKPLVHNFVGAKQIYDEKYVWSTIEELVEILSSEDYKSEEYYSFVEKHYSLASVLHQVKVLLSNLVDNGTLNKSEEDNKVLRQPKLVNNSFNYADYWNTRLNQKFDIEGVGYLGLGTIYNQNMYSIRFDILDLLIEKLFGTLKGKSVLELGPGIGLYTEYFNKSNIHDYKGIDIAKKSIEELSKEYPTFGFTNGDVSNPQFYEQNKYDLVFAADVLLHITNEISYKQTIRNISSSLKRDGFAILFDPISLIGTQSESSHVVIRDIEYIKNVFENEDLELVKLLPTAFFMNYPFDAKILENKEIVVRNLFCYIQNIFANNNLSNEFMVKLCKWITNIEKSLLTKKQLGLSQKVIVLKKNTNERIIEDFSITEVWKENKSLENEKRLLLEESNPEQEQIIKQFEHYINNLL